MWQNRLLLGICIVGMGIYTSNFGGRISYTLFYFVLLLPFVCILYTLYVYMRFKYYQTTGGRKIIKREPTDYLLQIGNEDILAYSNIKIEFFREKSTILIKDNEAEISLIPGDRKEIHTKLCCDYRGEYYVGVQYFVITDPLFLFTIRYPVKTKLPVNVIPRIVEWKYPDSILEDEDVKKSQTYKNRELEPEAEVKKYMQGDSLKRVHWKASAKKGELLVRKYEETSKRRILLLLDFTPVEGKEFDKIIVEDAIMEQALSLVNFCVQKSIPCHIQYAGKKIQEVSVCNQKQMEEFYEICCELHFVSRLSAAKMTQMSYSREEGENYILLTAVLNTEVYKECIHYHRSEKQISLVLICLSVSEEQKEWIQDLNREGIRVHVFPIQVKGAADEI